MSKTTKVSVKSCRARKKREMFLLVDVTRICDTLFVTLVLNRGHMDYFDTFTQKDVSEACCSFQLEYDGHSGFTCYDEDLDFMVPRLNAIEGYICPILRKRRVAKVYSEDFRCALALPSIDVAAPRKLKNVLNSKPHVLIRSFTGAV